ncbi:MAG: InlB B-repeat-containing protein, partial [Spirochaetota bacterium]
DRATGYVLYYQAAAATGGKFVDVGSRTEYVVQGLASNTSYTFQVAAKAAGFWNSPLSAKASGKTLPQTFTLRFESKGGTAIADMPVTEGVTASKPLSKKDGHFLYGWYMDEGFSKAFNFQSFRAPQSKALTLYAKWLDTSGYRVSYSTAGNKHYWAKEKLSRAGADTWTAITDQTVTLEASGVPSGVSSTIYYNNLDLTITETNSSIGTAPSIPKLASVSETGVQAYSDSKVTLSKLSGKAKVYGLASRVFIEDAHGEQRPAGKMLAEFYFLNDQKGPALIDLKSNETDDQGNEKAGTQVISSLFVKKDEHVRMRVLTSSQTQNTYSPSITVYDSDEQDASKKWKQIFYFDTTDSASLSKATINNAGTHRAKYISDVVGKSKSTYTEDDESYYSSVNVHFEMRGLVKSMPMQLKEKPSAMLRSGSGDDIQFWVLVE